MTPNCQSCGMPMDKCPQGGGSEADGTKSAEYCSYCYRQGQFTQPDLTLAEMQALCIDKLKEQGMPRPLGWLVSRGIPRLKRWR